MAIDIKTRATILVFIRRACLSKNITSEQWILLQVILYDKISFKCLVEKGQNIMQFCMPRNMWAKLEIGVTPSLHMPVFTSECLNITLKLLKNKKNNNNGGNYNENIELNSPWPGQ